jgi:hypothetical protein
MEHMRVLLRRGKGVNGGIGPGHFSCIRFFRLFPALKHCPCSICMDIRTKQKGSQIRLIVLCAVEC